MVLEQLLQAFSQRLSIDFPEPDDRGEYAFTFDGSLAMRCIPGGSDGVVLCGKIGPTPDDEREAEDHIRGMLKRSLARMKSQQEILSMEPDTGHIILFRQVRTGDLSVADFEEVVEGFVNSLEYWVNIAGATTEKAASPFSMIIP